MNKTKVLVISAIGEQNLIRIAGVSPGVILADSSSIWNAPDPLSKDKKEEATSEEFEAMLAEAEVIYGQILPRSIIARAPNLKWIQTMGVGVDGILTPEVVKSRVIITNMGSVRSIPVAESAIELMVLLAKKATLLLQNQQEKRWERYVPELLHSKTVGIVGLGNIGKGVARISKAFSMRVIATRRSARRMTQTRHVDLLMPMEQLPQLLAESDFVVLALPGTTETKGIIGEKELITMKPTAYLVNVGRGITVDEAALIRALEKKWIAGAGLDTYIKEPLPPENRLWKLPNVIVSPHIGGEMEDYNEKATEAFCANLGRYIEGKKLHNIVNKKQGY